MAISVIICGVWTNRLPLGLGAIYRYTQIPGYYYFYVSHEQLRIYDVNCELIIKDVINMVFSHSSPSQNGSGWHGMFCACTVFVSDT